MLERHDLCEQRLASGRGLYTLWKRYRNSRALSSQSFHLALNGGEEFTFVQALSAIIEGGILTDLEQ